MCFEFKSHSFNPWKLDVAGKRSLPEDHLPINVDWGVQILAGVQMQPFTSMPILPTGEPCNSLEVKGALLALPPHDILRSGTQAFQTQKFGHP